MAYSSREKPKESAAVVLVRLVREDDNIPVVFWKGAETAANKDGLSGIWKINFTLPAGGMYRLETGVDVGLNSSRQSMLRDDIRMHLGVGNIFVIAGHSNAAGYGRDNT